MAAPFVQGRLTNERLSVSIDTACAHCGQPLRLTVDSDMRSAAADPAAAPLVFEPQVDWASFRDPNIIHKY